VLSNFGVHFIREQSEQLLPMSEHSYCTHWVIFEPKFVVYWGPFPHMWINFCQIWKFGTCTLSRHLWANSEVISEGLPCTKKTVATVWPALSPIYASCIPTRFGLSEMQMEQSPYTLPTHFFPKTIVQMQNGDMKMWFCWLERCGIGHIGV